MGGDEGAVTAVETGTSELAHRIADVPRPEPVLSRERAAALTPRQRELLDELTGLTADGFSHLTMADLAAHLNCSLRTLYALASTREELMLMVVDRNLWEIGRSAYGAAGADAVAAPLDALRTYLAAANVAVSRTTPGFARDLAALPGGPDLAAAHNEYLVAVTTALLDWAMERSEIPAVHTAVVARAMAGLGREFSRPDVLSGLAVSPKDAADHVVDIILRGLVAPPRSRPTREDPCNCPT